MKSHGHKLKQPPRGQLLPLKTNGHPVAESHLGIELFECLFRGSHAGAPSEARAKNMVLSQVAPSVPKLAGVGRKESDCDISVFQVSARACEDNVGSVPRWQKADAEAPNALQAVPKGGHKDNALSRAATDIPDVHANPVRTATPFNNNLKVWL
jgi:cytochrome c556